MQATNQQIKALRPLLSKNDKETVAQQASVSIRTVEAILQGDRRNDKVESLLLEYAESNLVELQSIIQDIKAKNRDYFITEKGYEKKVSSPGWAQGHNYLRHIDIYLQLSHLKFNSLDDLWTTLTEKHRDLIHLDYYCVAVIKRVMGIPVKEAVVYYNKKTSL